MTAVAAVAAVPLVAAATSSDIVVAHFVKIWLIISWELAAALLPALEELVG